MSSQAEPKADGAAFDDFFESLGKKAENLTINEQNAEMKEGESNGALLTDDDDQRVVDEIESLCMNCHENVGTPFLLRQPDANFARELLASSSHEFLTSAKLF